MSSDISISVRNLSKVFHIYERPEDRLKQMIWRGRRKYHDEFWALQDISFEVKKGETVGIVGKNGSGKSTLLQIICGTLSPTSGVVERSGRLSALLELGSGFNPEFTGRENVYLNGAILGFSRAEMDSRFDDILGFADIGQFIDSPVKNYSSGMFARLAFSVAIHVDPQILIVDEILAVGDVAFQRKCLNKFYEIRERGCSILFVSHDPYQVKSICQRAIYLTAGRQRIFGAAGDVIDQYMIDAEEKVTSSGSSVNGGGSLLPGVEGRGENAQKSLDEVLGQAQQLFRISSVSLLNAQGDETDFVQTGDHIRLQFSFIALTDKLPENISFVFNLHRHDDLYLCGTTTLIDGCEPHKSSRKGVVTIDFPDLPLLSGQYKWRVAINDHVGFVTHAEAKDVCQFRVNDGFKAVGMINLPRTWTVSLD